MRNSLLLAAAAGVALSATALRAQPPIAPRTDSNSHWLDYKTDLSEARRELRSDLADARDRADRVDAWAEYDREVADARHDYAKEMAERGYRAGALRGGRGTVTVSAD